MPHSLKPSYTDTIKPLPLIQPTLSPLYKQIKGLLLQQLDSGIWKAGQLLPSEMELATQFNVSQGTVRKAIDELVAEHLLLRHQGKGTYVATHSETDVQYRFLRLRPNVGERKVALSHILSFQIIINPPNNIVKQLGLDLNQHAILIERTLNFSDKPTVFERVWLNQSLFLGLTEERLSQFKGALYALFETEFGVRMTRASEQLRAVSADEQLATILGIVQGDPVLHAIRYSYSYQQQIVEVREAWYVTQDYFYWSELD